MGSSGGRHFGVAGSARPLAGLAMVVAIVAVVALAVYLFQGNYRDTAGVTVISERAGLVMNPDAKVKMRGVQVGTVESVAHRADGTAAIELAIDKDQLDLIPGNVGVDIASSTVFGAKSVMLTAPADPSAEHLREGDAVLLKASRGARLDEVAATLK